MPAINFFPQNTFSWYKLIAVFGLVEDLFYKNRGYGNIAGHQHAGHALYKESDWLTITPKSTAVELTCDFKESPQTIFKSSGINNYSCLLCVGIAFGSMVRGQVEMVKYVGGGKILAVS